MKGLRLLCERNYRLIYKTNLGFTTVFMSVDHSREVTRMQHETDFCYATSLQGFGYGDVVHQSEKRCKIIVSYQLKGGISLQDELKVPH